MLGDSIFIQSLIKHCEQPRPTQAALAACCKEILHHFKFDCVFIARSGAPEEAPAPLAFEGKEDVMDTCLYRLGVEERLALSQVSLKHYLDITGKPVFNRAGSLRIQKPNSGIFVSYFRPKHDFIILGCAHQDARPYDQALLNELTNIWKALQDPLRDAIQLILKSGKVETPQTTVKAAEAPKVEKKAVEHPEFKFAEEKVAPPPFKAVPVAAPKRDEKSTKRKRPVVLVDEVTRLFNKDYFEECLAIEVERAKRYSRSVSILFLSVSPAPGHPASPGMDGVATQVAEILNKSLRQVDIICRLEKDKYGIILPDTSNQTYGVIAKRVFRYFKEVMGEAPPVFLNISASTYPKHAGNHLLLFENAEKLLAQAKEVGPNKAVLPE